MRVVAVRLAVCLAVVVSLSGCTATVTGTPTPAPPTSPATVVPPGPAATPYSDARNRFRIAPPPRWAVDTSGIGGTSVVFRDPVATPAGARTFNANINVVVLPAGATLAATIDGARLALRALPGYTPTADEDVVLADGTPAHQLGGTFTEQGTQLRNVQMFTVGGRASVVATGTAPAASWASFAGVFDAALRTLTLP